MRFCKNLPCLLTGALLSRCTSFSIDRRFAGLQNYCITSIPVSKRGTITLLPDMRRKLGLDAAVHPMMLVELRDGGIFLQPAEALPIRDIPEETLQGWIAEDERDADEFWRKKSNVLPTLDKGDFGLLLGTTVYWIRVSTPRDFLIEGGLG
jgi:hypothetical protein